MILAACTAGDDADPDSAAPTGADDTNDTAGVRAVRIVSFNTGTTPGLDHDGTDDGYTQAMADAADALYRNSLSWRPAERSVAAFLADVQPDLAGFQEIFHDPWCADIDVDPALDFVCDDWTPGRRIQTLRVLGEGYQVACHPGKPDKCFAVRRALGTFRGCDADVCDDVVRGAIVEGCSSSGARVASAVIDLTAGGSLTLTHVHGSSGFALDDQQCRRTQLEAVFEGLDGAPPLADGARNVILGDFNTDPTRFADFDPSAAYLAAQAGAAGFTFLNDVRADATPTYGPGLATIDHVLSDAMTGSCRHPGVTPGTNPVTDATYFDHVPLVCEATFVAPPR